MESEYATLDEFDSLLRACHEAQDSEIQGLIDGRFTSSEGVSRWIGFCQATFRLDADKYAVSFAVSVMAASGLALACLTGKQVRECLSSIGCFCQPSRPGFPRTTRS